MAFTKFVIIDFVMEFLCIKCSKPILDNSMVESYVEDSTQKLLLIDSKSKYVFAIPQPKSPFFLLEKCHLIEFFLFN
jgi:hypothetical protein